MTKVDIINKKEFIITKDGEIYKYKFKDDLSFEDYIKNLKSNLRILKIDIEKDINLNEVIKNIRELYKEELIELLLKGELY